MSAKPKLIVIGGPTASGKTAMAIKLAQKLECEIFSADSRQIYKEMNIGVAKPSHEEMELVKHHLIGYVSILNQYDAAKYEKDALSKLDLYFKEHDTAILVGGTGFYIKAVIEGLDYFPEVDPQILKDLEDTLENEGIHKLAEMLQVEDPITYNQIDLKNSRRIIRALSVCKVAGKPFSSFLNKEKASRTFDTLKYHIDIDRAILYDRINARVDQMFSEGLLEEAKSLINHKDLKPLQTIGYKEPFRYLLGEWDLNHAVMKMKQHTRNYAKRQTTWFNNSFKGQAIDTSHIKRILDEIKL